MMQYEFTPFSFCFSLSSRIQAQQPNIIGMTIGAEYSLTHNFIGSLSFQDCPVLILPTASNVFQCLNVTCWSPPLWSQLQDIPLRRHFTASDFPLLHFEANSGVLLYSSIDSVSYCFFGQ